MIIGRALIFDKFYRLLRNERKSCHTLFISLKVWLVGIEMSSMAFSVPKGFRTSAAQAQLHIALSGTNTEISSPASIRIPTNNPKSCYDPPLVRLDNEENPTVLNRREAMGFSLRVGFGLVGTALLLQSSQVRAAEVVSACEFTSTTSGLAFCDKVVGTGPQAIKGQLIKANYVGKLENGKIFDSSYERGKPLTFRVGVGEVIKGWDQGILGGEGIPPMLAGGKRTLRLPPELGYGTRGAGCRGGSCVIPPDSVLEFDVEFIGKV